MKYLAPILALLVLNLATGHALAQDVPTAAAKAQLVLTSADVSLWPEYDRPDMLVIYRGQFAAETPLPVPAEVRIPASIGLPSAVAYLGDDGGQYNQPYETRTEGEWVVVAFSLPTRGFQLEFYAPMTLDGAQRSFSYTYIADYPVTAVQLDVQVPPTAENFVLDPAADSVVQEDNGVFFQLATAGPLAAGDTRTWALTYRKADSSLTAETTQTGATSGSGAPEATGAGNSTVLIFLIAFVGLVAVGVSAFWLGRRVQTAPPPAVGSVQRGASTGLRGRRVSASRSSALDDALFCHECGARLRPDAEYCHKCGAAVRRAE